MTVPEEVNALGQSSNKHTTTTGRFRSKDRTDSSRRRDSRPSSKDVVAFIAVNSMMRRNKRVLRTELLVENARKRIISRLYASLKPSVVETTAFNSCRVKIY
jgi:hypothetical protein